MRPRYREQVKHQSAALQQNPVSLASDHQPTVRMRPIWETVLSQVRKVLPRPHRNVSVSPPLTYAEEAIDGERLAASMTTFGQSVGSFVPATFEAYARFYHAIRPNGADSVPPTWRTLAEVHRIDLHDSAAVTEVVEMIRSDFWVEAGSLCASELCVLLEHLSLATGTGDHCFFAVWEGFGDSPVPAHLRPTLHLPGRAYHMFKGPLGGANVNLSSSTITSRSANLWWPADHAWCVATEIDFPWTYVGGSRACIDRLVADVRLDAQNVQVSACR